MKTGPRIADVESATFFFLTRLGAQSRLEEKYGSTNAICTRVAVNDVTLRRVHFYSLINHDCVHAGIAPGLRVR